MKTSIPSFLTTILLIISALVVASVGYYFLFDIRFHSPTSDTSVDLVADYLDLGIQPETQQYIHRFRIKNITSKLIRVDQLTSTCDCVSLIPDRDITVPAGDSVEVTVTLRIQARSDCRGLQDSDYAEIPIWAYYSRADGVQLKTGWPIKCKIVQSIIPVEPILSLGMQSIDQPSLVRNTEISASQDVKQIECEGSVHWSVIIDEIPNRSPRKFVASLYWDGERKLSEFNDILKLSPIDRQGKVMSTKYVRCFGEWVEDVITIPRIISFGRRRIGNEASEAIRFRSLTDTKFSIGDFKTGTDANTSVERCKDSIGEFFVIKQRFAESGQQRVKVLFDLTRPSGRPSYLTVPVSILASTNDFLNFSSAGDD